MVLIRDSEGFRDVERKFQDSESTQGVSLANTLRFSKQNDSVL